MHARLFFEDGLSKMGYNDNHKKHYAKYPLKFVKFVNYSVEEGFPKILRGDINNEIMNAKYEIKIPDYDLFGVDRVLIDYVEEFLK